MEETDDFKFPQFDTDKSHKRNLSRGPTEGATINKLPGHKKSRKSLERNKMKYFFKDHLWRFISWILLRHLRNLMRGFATKEIYQIIQGKQKLFFLDKKCF